MTQEKQLLLQDLCGRLPYGLIGEYSWKNHEPYNRELTGSLFDELKSSWDSTEDSQFLPYLRPMSSMTKEEYNELGDLLKSEDSDFKLNEVMATIEIDWFNKKMFDYRGLIHMGLANSTEEFNPYKEEFNKN